jgi:prolyl-tRNA synthetase
MHRTAEEAEARTVQMLNIYGDFFEKDLAMPVIRGQKTDKEKFAGAKATYTVEALMHDGKALQGGTSHNFGSDFARAFGIQFLDSDNTLKNPHQTSWGVSTRIIGGIIMTHGDDSGLVLPPSVAPIQVVIVPIQQFKEGVLDAAGALYNTLKAAGIRVKLDDSDQSPGWKFAEYEMKGVPLRIELGPRDLAENKCVIVRRDNREKSFVSIETIVDSVKTSLENLKEALFQKALMHREERTFTAHNLDELKKLADTESGYIKAMWCGELECELKLKEEADVSSRCMPFGASAVDTKCVCCQREAKKLVYWGKAY